MKSIQGVVEAKCPHCSAAPFEAEVWSFIRADSDPDLRDAVRYGELNLLECEACGNFFYHEAPVVYFDPEAELLVFVMPHSYEAEAGKWREKMKADYAAIRDGLSREMKIDYEPLIFFGAEHLQQLLEDMLDAEDENASIEAAALSLGFKIAPFSPAKARAAGYPCRIPYAGAKPAPESFVNAALEILASGLESPKLKKLLADVNSDAAKFPVR
ncbi:MAG: hypothetical protein GX410_03765 [Elusimicrobia bacterium]|nr:hypothetical protein [Elusimicrobiota bacterium]